MTRARLGSTYRLQLQGLGFRAAEALIPYLSDLGVETLYLSPVLAAVPGSTHGYDVVDPTRLDPSLGTDEDLGGLFSALLAHGMRALLDIVPNHMAVDRANAWWWDVLRRGRDSDAAAVFDIDWSRHEGRVLVPVLGRPLSELLAAGDVLVDRAEGLIQVGETTTFPLADDPPKGPPAVVLAAQHYRPAHWRDGPAEGNYRRFFDINTLIGIRVEDVDVFERTHLLIRSLAGHPAVAGVRVDHIDGLADPAAYLRRLRDLIDDPDAALIVEKILGPDEALDPRWPVDGTTGYEFADHALALFVDPDGADHLRELGAALTNSADATFCTASLRAKREVLELSFPGDLDRLTRLTHALLDRTMPGHDLSPHGIRRAWTELTVHLDIYRTYLDGQRPTSAADRARIEEASASAREASGFGRDGADAHEVARALTVITAGLLHETESNGPWLEVALRWQQLSGAVMAKGVEDTATYRDTGLSARCDVGSDPDIRLSPEGFHGFVAGRGQHGLNATSTHDSKRNEDARCRLAVLSEVAGDWAALVEAWHRRFIVDDTSARGPQPLEELRAYETLFALWPSVAEKRINGELVARATSYGLKAAREAKVNTSWTEPDEAYEARVCSFVERTAQDPDFCRAMTGLSQTIDSALLCNSLALVVLKTCCPGVPDFYQGTEYVEAVLTDPDNRRPVDFAARAASLAALPEPSAEAAARLLAAGSNGPLKLFVTRLLLRERRRTPDLFARGSYGAFPTNSAHALAFGREHEGERLLAVVAIRTLRVARGAAPVGKDAWGDTAISLPPEWAGRYVDVLSDRAVTAPAGALALHEALGVLPVAVLRARRDV